MRVDDVSHITQRMVFLRIYEVLVEANQSVVDRRDFQPVEAKEAQLNQTVHLNYDAGYPFCYFTGQVLNDLLAQPIVWRGLHLTLEEAVHQIQPDMADWLTIEVRQIPINDFFGWQPHTLRVQELVDDVKQRVLDVVDAIHSVEKLQTMESVPKVLHIHLGAGQRRSITTGGVVHSLSYCLREPFFEPVVYDAASTVSQKWFMHALIHGVWLVGQVGGYIRVDTAEQRSEDQILRAPLYLI